MKKNLSKILTLVLVIALSIGLSACTGPDSTEVDLSVEKQKEDQSIIEKANQEPPKEDINLQADNQVKKTSSDVNLEGNISMSDAQNADLNTQVAQDQTQQAQPILADKATLQTSKGNIVVKLYPDSAPKTVQNFLSKAQSDYYKNLNFHRVESWVIQGGDPKGNGTGGGAMPTELSQVPFKIGSLGVARGGNIQVSNDSQFFICTDDCSWLTGQYTNFGEVIEGMEIAKSIAVGDKILGISYQ